MRLSSSRYKEILIIVRSLLLSNATSNALPIAILSVIRKYKKNIRCISYSNYAKLCGTNVEFIIKEFGSKHGFTMYNPLDDTYIIAYNDSDNKYSIRWTLAHELGHILLGHLKDENYTFETSCDPESIYEAEANWFARNFLVPFSVLDILHRNLSLNTELLMDLFEVNHFPAEKILNHYNKLIYYGYDFQMEDKFYEATMSYISDYTKEDFTSYLNSISYFESEYYTDYI